MPMIVHAITTLRLREPIIIAISTLYAIILLITSYAIAAIRFTPIIIAAITFTLIEILLTAIYCRYDAFSHITPH